MASTSTLRSRGGIEVIGDWGVEGDTPAICLISRRSAMGERADGLAFRPLEGVGHSCSPQGTASTPTTLGMGQACVSPSSSRKPVS